MKAVIQNSFITIHLFFVNLIYEHYRTFFFFVHFTVAPPPVNVFIPRSTASSFTVTWSAAAPANLNGNITGYDIQYQLIDGGPDVGAAEISVMANSLAVEYTVQDLPQENTYTVRVGVKDII